MFQTERLSSLSVSVSIYLTAPRRSDRVQPCFRLTSQVQVFSIQPLKCTLKMIDERCYRRPHKYQLYLATFPLSPNRRS